MVVQIPVVLYSGGHYPRGFRTLDPNDTVPGTDTTRVPISGGYMTGQLFAASGVVVSGTLSRNGFNVVTVGDVETVTSTMIASGTIIDADVNISGAINATKLSFLQAGIGAVARSVDSKLKDSVSALDIGIVAGDTSANATTNTAVLHAWLNEATNNKAIYFPRNIYHFNSVTLPDNVTLLADPSEQFGEAATLKFLGLTTGQKAITLGVANIVYGLHIQGAETAGGVASSSLDSIGIYGGEYPTTPGLDFKGANCTFEQIGVSGFTTNAYFSKWSNTIRNSQFSISKTHLRLTSAANYFIFEGNKVLVGSNSPQTGVKIDGGDSISIVDNLFEPVYIGIDVISGKVNIARNYFEITNLYFIIVRGDSTNILSQPVVNITDNFMLDNGVNASALTRYGILIQRGYTRAEGNHIRAYTAATNNGLGYGIRIDSDGTYLEGAYIGMNYIGAFKPLEASNFFSATSKIDTPFTLEANIDYDLVGTYRGCHSIVPAKEQDSTRKLFNFNYLREVRAQVETPPNRDYIVTLSRVTSSGLERIDNNTATIPSGTARGDAVEYTAANVSGFVSGYTTPIILDSSATIGSGNISARATLGIMRCKDLSS